VRGAREALEPLLRWTGGDFRMAWVFIDMMKTDTPAAAGEAASRTASPRLTAFHDPHHVLGRAMARRLGWQCHVAWDTYFVYRPGVRWTDHDLPVPDIWAHQLQDREVWERTAESEFGTSEWTEALPKASEADPAHFATGRDLFVVLTNGIAQSSAAISSTT
jgi:hypothetical protein